MFHISFLDENDDLDNGGSIGTVVTYDCDEFRGCFLLSKKIKKCLVVERR